LSFFSNYIESDKNKSGGIMLQHIIDKALKAIDNAENLKRLEEIKVEFLGKSSAISLESRKMSGLDEEGKKELGKVLNNTKAQITNKLDSKFIYLKKLERDSQLEFEKIDMTLPPRPHVSGSIHPITQATEELLEIFVRMGFEIKDGPSIEDDWHNFTALNIPEHHPAREMHDTFYLSENFLLRTHTSTVQIRSMTNSNPPFRFVAPGRVYRCDSDMTHTPMFHQIEALVVDEKLHMGHLKHCITEFIKQFFEQDSMEVRIRPSFFPFTEPSAEIDIRMSENNKWLEVGGCGMVHPNVLKNCKIDSEQYSGFAFGMGIDRLAMLKYGISDLRQFFDSDKRWLDHYSFSGFDIPSFTGGLTR
jgi:phenylalanyl-tRNA synthetase alpha chain